jgi:hypothetical protein
MNENDFLNEVTGATQSSEQLAAEQVTTTQGQSISIGQMIDEKFIVEVVDRVGAAVGTIACHQFGWTKAKPKDFSASASEKKALEQPMRMALDASNITISSPWEALLLAFVATYGSKVAMYMGSNEMTPKDTPEAEKKKETRGRKPKNLLADKKDE